MSDVYFALILANIWLASGDIPAILKWAFGVFWLIVAVTLKLTAESSP